MKNHSKILAFLIVVLGLISCEENFVVQNEFKDAYVLNCLVNATSTKSLATISRTYEVKDKYSGQNYSERLIANALVYIKHGNDTIVFKDSTTTLTDSDGNEREVNFYYTNELRNTRSRDLFIVAVLPDGDTLKSETTVPSRIIFDYSFTGELVLSDEEFESFTIGWKDEFNDSPYYDPRLKIVYYKLIDGEYVMFTKRVPIKYDEYDGKKIPFYISPSFSKRITYSMDVFSDMMVQISDGDPDKQNYFISYAEIEVYTYDQFLTGYYIGSHFLDKYSIRLDEIDYSNIEGGYGLFASYDKVSQKIAIDPRYIKKYGYQAYFGK